jgi:protein-disulfide isomerase
MSRNTLIGVAAAAIIVVAGLAWWQFSSVPETTAPQQTTDRADGAQVDLAKLLEPGPLEEMVLGEADAPVTVVEYASMTCSHCASFHNNIYPAFREKYIDTGKVRFIFREFPLDPLATGAFMLARCTGKENYFPFIEALFHNQESWTRTNEPVKALFALSRQVGFTEESFDTCLANQQLLNQINAVRDRAETEFDVQSTPTFFINGRIARGVQSLEDFERHFAPYLGS